MGCALAASSDASDAQLWHEWWEKLQKNIVHRLQFVSLPTLHCCLKSFILVVAVQVCFYYRTCPQCSLPLSSYNTSIAWPGEKSHVLFHSIATTHFIHTPSSFCRLLHIHFSKLHSKLRILVRPCRFQSLEMKLQSSSLASNQTLITCTGQWTEVLLSSQRTSVSHFGQVRVQLFVRSCFWR